MIDTVSSRTATESQKSKESSERIGTAVSWRNSLGKRAARIRKIKPRNVQPTNTTSTHLDFRKRKRTWSRRSVAAGGIFAFGLGSGLLFHWTGRLSMHITSKKNESSPPTEPGPA